MTRLRERGNAVDLQVLDNEASNEYRRVITQTWKANFQLVPPDVHCCNAAERSIRTFKAHFLAILPGRLQCFTQIHLVQAPAPDQTHSQPTPTNHTCTRHVSVVILQGSC